MSIPEPIVATEPESKPLWVRAWRGAPGLVLRILIALLPFIWLAKRVTLAEILEYTREAGLKSFALGIGALAFAAIPATLRWKVLLQAYGAKSTPRFPSLLRHNLVCAYYNALPSGVAGDLVRAHRVRDYVPNVATSYAIVFVERITGLLGLLILAGFTVLIGEERGLEGSFVRTSMALTGLLALGASSVLFVFPYLLERYSRLSRALLRIPLVGKVAHGIPKPRSVLGLKKAVLFSLLTQGSAIMSITLLTRPLVEPSQLIACIQVMPLAILLTYIPLTPGGVAQREAIYAYLYGLAGVVPAIAVAISLLFFAAQMSIAAVGGIVHLVEKLAEPKEG